MKQTQGAAIHVYGNGSPFQMEDGRIEGNEFGKHKDELSMG